MRWSEIPREAKAYMIYHTLIAPGLITWTLFPLYLMMTGYSVLEVGAFFTIVTSPRSRSPTSSAGSSTAGISKRAS